MKVLYDLVEKVQVAGLKGKDVLFICIVLARGMN